MINTAFFQPRNLLFILLVGYLATMLSNAFYERFVSQPVSD